MQDLEESLRRMELEAPLAASTDVVARLVDYAAYMRGDIERLKSELHHAKVRIADLEGQMRQLGHSDEEMSIGGNNGAGFINLL